MSEAKDKVQEALDNLKSSIDKFEVKATEAKDEYQTKEIKSNGK